MGELVVGVSECCVGSEYIGSRDVITLLDILFKS